MHCVYILYSKSVDRYYVGESNDLKQRIEQHNSSHYKGSYTTIANDWYLYLEIKCESPTQAKKLEAFIKRMKSRKFIERLKSEPTIAEELKMKM